MAKILSKSGITSLSVVKPGQVSQSIDAFTGVHAYDISLSGSFNMTGSITGSSIVSMLTASIGGGMFTSASLTANSGVSTLQQVTDQGSITTTPITASNISSSGEITCDDLTATGDVSSSGTFIGDGSTLTNLQRPITSSTTHFTASNNNTGFYFRANGGVTCSIQPNSVVTCDIGNEFEIFQTSSAGYVLFATGSGVTLNSKSGNQKLTGQFSAATLKKIGTDEWDLIGDLG